MSSSLILTHVAKAEEHLDLNTLRGQKFDYGLWELLTVRSEYGYEDGLMLSSLRPSALPGFLYVWTDGIMISPANNNWWRHYAHGHNPRFGRYGGWQNKWAHPRLVKPLKQVNSDSFSVYGARLFVLKKFVLKLLEIENVWMRSLIVSPTQTSPTASLRVQADEPKCPRELCVFLEFPVLGHPSSHIYLQPTTSCHSPVHRLTIFFGEYPRGTLGAI